MKLTLVTVDFNIRLDTTQDQKGARNKRGGEKAAPVALADCLIREIDGADTIIIHGGKCRLDFTVQPDRKAKAGAPTRTDPSSTT